jgi:hypothetical protein
MKSIFVALVCVLSLIALGPSVSWSDEASNQFVFGNTLTTWNPIQSGAGLFAWAAGNTPPDILLPGPQNNRPSGNPVFDNLFDHPFDDIDGLLPLPDGLLPAPIRNFPWTQFVVPPGAQFEQHEWTSLIDGITTVINSVTYKGPPVPELFNGLAVPLLFSKPSAKP